VRRADWEALASAINQARQLDGIDQATVDVIADVIAKTLDGRSSRFSQERFRNWAGVSATFGKPTDGGTP
jgi:hypothetical protein